MAVFALSGLKPRQWGRADANFNYCISWDCGALPWGSYWRWSPLPYADCAYLIGHFIEFWRRTADYRIVYVFGHAAVVYGEGTSIDKLIRALVGVILFQSAYVAEVVRGGLQGAA